MVASPPSKDCACCDHELERQARNRDRPAHNGQPKDADAPHPDPWLVQQAEGPDREDDAKLGGVYPEEKMEANIVRLMNCPARPGVFLEHDLPGDRHRQGNSTAGFLRIDCLSSTTVLLWTGRGRFMRQPRGVHLPIPRVKRLTTLG